MRPEQLVIIRRDVPKNLVNPPTREGFAADSFLIIEHRILGEVAVVRKKTQYVCGPADAMVIPLDLNVCQLTELDKTKGSAFLQLCGEIGREMKAVGGNGYLVIAVNQQEECVNLPNKYATDGTELKVQSIDWLHAHVFLEDGSGHKYKRIVELDPVAKNDFRDPISLAISDILRTQVTEILDNQKFMADVALLTDSFPLGVDVSFAQNLDALTQNTATFSFLSEVQEKFVNLYRSIESYSTSANIGKKDNLEILLNRLGATPLNRRFVRTLASLLRVNSEEVDMHLRFVKGPALTWILYENNGKSHINLTPRFLSRGNAMEALGIWTEPIEGSEKTNGKSQYDFYRSLMVKLARRYNVNAGQVLLNYENNR